MKTEAPANSVDRLIRAAAAGDEAVFAEPWEARAFALAVTLSRGGLFSWDEFRDRLIAKIAQADAAATPVPLEIGVTNAESPSGPYYEAWLKALEQLLREKSLLRLEEIDRRAAAIAASPPAPTKAQGRGPITIA